MERLLQPHFYRGVPVILWPFVLWQLWRLQAWVARTGRDVMLGVCPRSGRVHVLMIGPDPDAPRAWTPPGWAREHAPWLNARCPGDAEAFWSRGAGMAWRRLARTDCACLPALAPAPAIDNSS